MINLFLRQLIIIQDCENPRQGQEQGNYVGEQGGGGEERTSLLK